jgi:FkbM family methyltransferase
MQNFIVAPGIQFDFIDPDNSTLRETVPGNTYEPAVVQTLLQALKPNDVVLDIGALYGFFGCLCAKTHPDVTVYAFDPCQDYCDVISHNARLNGLNHLYAVPMALSDSAEHWEFKEKTLIAGSKGSTHINDASPQIPLDLSADVSNLNSGEWRQPVSPLSWAVATVRYLFRKLTRPPKMLGISGIRYDDWAGEHQVKARIAKIDVHGAEVLVLRGMTKALREDIEVLILEVHRIDMLVDGNYQEIIDLLLNAGFKLHELIDFRSDKKWQLKAMSVKDIEDFVDSEKWSIKNKIEMRMIYATKGARNAI